MNIINKTNWDYILIEGEKEIIEVLEIIINFKPHKYKWTIHEISVVGSLEMIELIPKYESKKEKVIPLNDKTILSLFKEIQTDWGIIFAFDLAQPIYFAHKIVFNPIEHYQMQNNLAKIEIRSLDGDKIMVLSKDKEIVELLKAKFTCIIRNKDNKKDIPEHF